MSVRVMVSALFVVGFSGTLTVAERNQAPKQSLEVILGGCERNNSDLSGAHHIAGAEGTIIAIARLGDGERSRALNRRRLHNVREFLTNFGWQRNPNTVITAEGERIKGYGRVELYVRGIPLIALAAKRNQDLLVGSCLGPDKNLYPYLDRKPQKPTATP